MTFELAPTRALQLQRCRGVSLIELLVAVTIGGILIFGATQVYVDSRNTYEVNEATARLQETARYALSVIEPDIRMANYWGLLKDARLITNQADQTAASAGAPTACGTNFARDLMINIEGSNNAYSLDCDAYKGPENDGDAMASADTLTVRRAAIDETPSENGRLQICSTRIMGQLIDDGAACTAAPNGRVNNLIVNTYYVSRDSVQRKELPALRRKRLTASTASGPLTPVFDDDEIVPGVEDLQVQLGVDSTGTSGIATRYVNPDAAIGPNEQIVAVRIWLLVRAETPEVGFVDGTTYVYADRDAASTTDDLNTAGAAQKAYAPQDGFRRLLVSRTIQIRNAVGT
jgi:type IV pilus assembly protein PilW